MSLIKLYLLQIVSLLKMSKKRSKEYIDELEEKILELSLKLKNNKEEFKLLKVQNDEINNQLIHNLKNPVGAVFSFSEMMLFENGKRDINKFNKHLQIIHNSSEFSIAILNKFSKYLGSTSNKNISVERIEYVSFLEKTLSGFQLMAIEKNNLISFDFDKKQVFLNFNEDDISFVINALIHNALRYSSDGGKIAVEIFEDGSQLTTKISDAGMGMSDKDLFKVFTPFFVVNTYSDDRKKCIGLSLAIVKKIIKKHGGSIKITSALNTGTTVIFSLPKN